jgi:glycerate kinase
MNECKDCKYAEDLQELKKEVLVICERVSKVEQTTAVSNEQIKMIFQILNEIKVSLTKIADKLDTKIAETSQRPANLLWGVAGAILITLITLGLKFI